MTNKPLDFMGDHLNLIITKACNKMCSFCFMDEKSKNSEMSLEFIQKLLDHYRPQFVRVLGGEPSRHSQFEEIILLLEKQQQSYTLISNLMFAPQVAEFLRDHPGKRDNILANGMELDKKNRINIFAQNMKILRDVTMLAITITRSTTIEEIQTYCQFLIDNIRYLPPGIRIGLDLCGTWMLNNTKIGDMIRAIQSAFPNQDIILDCQVPLCVWDFDPMAEGIRIVQGHHLCLGAPVDVFADGSAVYCYPASHIKVNDVFQYRNTWELAAALRRKYKEREKAVQIPDECKRCSSYLWNECPSLCMGCLDKLES